MKNRLESIVDLKKYPIHNLKSKKIKKIIEKCKKELNLFSCSTIPNFILPNSLKIMKKELEKQLGQVYMSKEKINPYLYAKDDKKLPIDHPKRIFMDRYNGYLNSDCFSKNSEMKFQNQNNDAMWSVKMF